MLLLVPVLYASPQDSPDRCTLTGESPASPASPEAQTLSAPNHTPYGNYTVEHLIIISSRALAAV